MSASSSPRRSRPARPSIRRHEVLAALAARLRNPGCARRGDRQGAGRYRYRGRGGRARRRGPRGRADHVGRAGSRIVPPAIRGPRPRRRGARIAGAVHRGARYGPGADRGAQRQGRRPRADTSRRSWKRDRVHPAWTSDWASGRSADTSHPGCSAPRSSWGSGTTPTASSSSRTGLRDRRSAKRSPWTRSSTSTSPRTARTVSATWASRASWRPRSVRGSSSDRRHRAPTSCMSATTPGLRLRAEVRSRPSLDGCPRFAALVIEGVVDRSVAGMAPPAASRPSGLAAPINNVVDITNCSVRAR